MKSPNQFQQMTHVQDAEQARRHVAYWADQGATSLKAYMQISRVALAAAIEEAHTRGMKVTGHLCYLTLFPKAMALELAFARAGGLLVAGTNPTGSGGVIPGYSNHRQIELLVDAGFTPLEALRIATLNGATYLGREKSIGSLAAGKQADLVVVGGDPSARIADIRNVEIVFRQGIGYDPGKLIASVAGRVGLF